MADTFSNDLRLRLQESGANSGQWGSLLNDTITNIASAFSLGSEAIPNASTHTITLADDSSSGDEARSLFLKCTGGGQACTVTLAPNTVSKVWIISNETSFTLTFSAGSGANVAVAAGAVKVIVTDGAGSGAAVVDALSGLSANVSDLTTTGNINFGDNDKAIFGAGGDLQISHNGSASLISDLGTGDLFIRASSALRLQSSANENYLVAVADGAVNLYHDNALKLATTSTGIDVTGDVSFGDNGKAIFGTDSDMSLFHNGNNGFLDCDTGTLFIQTDSLSVKNSAGTEVQMLAAADGAVALYHNNSAKLATTSTGIDVTGSVGIGTSSPATNLHVVRGTGTALSSVNARTAALFTNNSSAGAAISINAANTGYSGIFLGDPELETQGQIKLDHTTNSLEFTSQGGTSEFTISASAIVVNQPGTNTDFRVKSTGNDSMLFVDASTDRVGIGTSSPSTLVEASESQNTVTDVKVTNANTGTAAQARFTLGNSGANFGALGLLGGSFTTAGVFRQDGVYLFANGGGGLSLVTGAAQPIYFAINSSEKARIDSSGNAIFGSATANDSSSVTLRQDGTAHVNNAQFSNGNGSAGGTTPAIYSPASATLAISTNSAERLRMDGSGNLLVGRTSRLTGQVKSISSDTAMSVHGVLSQHQTNCGVFQYTSNALQIRAYGATSGTGNIQFKVGGGGDSADSEAARLTSNGTLLVGKTADDNSVGFKTNTSSTYMVANTACPTFINRLGNVGDLLEFRQDSSTVGSIGTVSGSLSLGSGDCYLEMSGTGNVIQPMGSVTGAASNGVIDLGASGRQFKDLYLSGKVFSDSALIGTTDNGPGSPDGIVIHSAGANVQNITTKSTTASAHYIGRFYSGDVEKGNIYFNGTDVQFNNLSDQRLKENIEDAPSASDDIDAIQVRSFNWKENGHHQKYGMVAQELNAVAPDAVSIPDDPEAMAGIDYSKLVPMLIKEIQSLRARVTQLETEE